MSRFTRKDFLDALFLNYFRRRQGFIMVRSSRGLDRKTSIRYFPNVEILAKEPYHFDQHVFFGVCPHEKMRSEKDHIRYLVALWAGMDLDPEGYSGKKAHFLGQAQAAKAIRSFPLPPSIIVESGQGVHLYWLLKDLSPVEDIDAVERLLGRINCYFKCNTEVGIDSMLRLPDTTNCGLAAAPAECRVKYLNPDFRYDLNEFEQLDLENTYSSSKSAVVMHSTDCATDAAVVEQTVEMNAAAATSGQRACNTAGDHVTHLGIAGHETKAAAGLQIGSLESPEPVEQKTEAMSSSEPADFKPMPYETIGSPSGQVLDSLADKLAEKITEKLSENLVDQIVDKVVERLIVAPR
jgi:hypothetical protein